jgi:hypothetical protein
MQKTSHPNDPAEMMAYLDGELPVDRAASAAAHLERCAECQELAADMRAVSQSLLSWQVESSEAVCPAAPTAVVKRRKWVMRPWVWGLVTAGVLAVLVAVPNRYRNAQKAAATARLSEFDRIDLGTRLHAVYVPTAPMVARTASLNLSSREFDRARPAIDGILQRHQGYLGSLNIAAPSGEPRTLTATLRIPAADLATAIDELKKLGRVESEQQNGEEVTEQYVDLEARLSNARNTGQRLTGILRERTGKLSDVLEVEKEIDRVRGEIEHMEGEKQALAKRVDFATVSLTVSEAGSASGRIGAAAAEGWRTMVASLVAVALFLAGTVPSVLLWAAVLFFPARYAWKRWR